MEDGVCDLTQLYFQIFSCIVSPQACLVLSCHDKTSDLILFVASDPPWLTSPVSRSVGSVANSIILSFCWCVWNDSFIFFFKPEAPQKTVQK